MVIKAIKKGLEAVVVALIIISIGAAVLIYSEHQRFRNDPLPIPSQGIAIEVPKGASLQKMANRLTEMGLIDSSWLWVLDARYRGIAHQIKAGEYQLSEGMTAEQVLQLWVQGEVVTYSLTVPEGYTFAQMRSIVDQNSMLTHVTKDWSVEQLMTALGQEGQHPEGRFMPETFQFSRGMKDLDLYRQSMRLMDEALASSWTQRDEGLPYASAYEALIMASIVEKETAVASERNTIAGVFVRRLRKGMRLQTDPTVIYGLGDRYKGDIKRVHLREATPYNTYVIRGMPPTPIALPGKAAIEAAVHPESGTSLFFVANGEGGHTFSDTLKEHQAAVRRYLNR